MNNYIWTQNILKQGEKWFQSLPNARGHRGRQEKSVQKSKTRSPISVTVETLTNYFSKALLIHICMYVGNKYLYEIVYTKLFKYSQRQ
jgi:hypothetical protein